MKILHIHPAMKGGGIEAMICALANEMSKTENVTVCSLFLPQSDDVFWNKLSPRVHKKTLGKCKEGISFKEIFKIYHYIKKLVSYGNYNLFLLKISKFFISNFI